MKDKILIFSGEFGTNFTGREPIKDTGCIQGSIEK